jgi:hypothetical protein
MSSRASILFVSLFILSCRPEAPVDTAVGAVGAVVSGPLRPSTVNPRYFTDGSGRAVLLAGSHTWDNRQDINAPANTFDWPGYLAFLTSHGNNFFRLWVDEESHAADSSFPAEAMTPAIYARAPSFYGTGGDGGRKFDLTHVNPSFLGRTRQRVIDAGSAGMYVAIMLFNGWSIEIKQGDLGNPWDTHPFNKNNNINGIDGDPNGDDSGAEVHTLAIPAVTTLQDQYVKAVIDAVNDLDNVVWEVSNEDDPTPEALAFDAHVVDLIHQYEATKPKQHPVGGFGPFFPDPANVSYAATRSSAAEWLSPTRTAPAPYDYFTDPPPADGTKVSVSDTDHIVGVGGTYDWVWRTFIRGHNLLYMDPYLFAYALPPPSGDESARFALGDVVGYAGRVDLLHMLPEGHGSTVCSTGYCLANPNLAYLVYDPAGGNFTVDLSGAAGQQFSVEWFDAQARTTTTGAAVSGGSVVAFSPPKGLVNRDCVLYLSAGGASLPPPPPPPPPPPTGEAPFGGSPWPIPGTIQAEDYDLGGEGVAYHDTDAQNQGGALRPSDGVDIGTDASTGALYVGWIWAGEWLQYTVNVAAAGSYDLSARVASAATGKKTFHVEVDGTDVTGPISFSDSAGWSAWVTLAQPRVALPAGVHALRVVMDASLFNVDWVAFAPSP